MSFSVLGVFVKCLERAHCLKLTYKHGHAYYNKPGSVHFKGISKSIRARPRGPSTDFNNIEKLGDRSRECACVGGGGEGLLILLGMGLNGCPQTSLSPSYTNEVAPLLPKYKH